MTRTSNIVAATSSTLLRIFSYVFLRWIPGHHLAPLIITLAILYFTAFIRLFLTTSPFEVIADEIDIITRETINQDDESEEEVELLDGADDGILEELDVTETVTLATKAPRRLRAILLGIPSPVSLLWTLLAASINLILIGMILDMVYRAPLFHEEQDLSFSRVGFVSYDRARVLVREPRIKELPLFLSYRYAGPALISPEGPVADAAWKHAAQVSDLAVETDYTVGTTISGLKPDTRYQYAWSNNQSGFFSTAPLPGVVPKANSGTFTFLFTSCMKPRVPYHPFDHPLHIQGLNHLETWVPKLHPQFMLFLGDFIYVDVPQRFGTDAETYRAEYRRMYASPDWPGATAELPWIHVIDDHEIENDWDKNTTGVYDAAVDPWLHYQAAVNPPAVHSGETYSSFTQGPVSIFMLETRRYRSTESKDATDPAKSMLGQKQLLALLDWINTKPPRGVKWKVVASSVPFTTNWRVGDVDTWGTYLAERRIILEAMWKANAQQDVGVVVISGDRHEFAATRIHDHTASVPGEVLELSVSPLNMFYLPVKTYKQRDNVDEEIKYIPQGNSKFGALEFSSEEHDAKMKFRLFVDGEEAWSKEWTPKLSH